MSNNKQEIKALAQSVEQVAMMVFRLGLHLGLFKIPDEAQQPQPEEPERKIIVPLKILGSKVDTPPDA